MVQPATHVDRCDSLAGFSFGKGKAKEEVPQREVATDRQEASGWHIGRMGERKPYAQAHNVVDRGGHHGADDVFWGR